MTVLVDSLRLDLGERSYEIAVGDGVLENAGAAIRAAAGKGKCWIVTD